MGFGFLYKIECLLGLDQKTGIDAIDRVSLFFIQAAILLYQKLLEFITRCTTMSSNNTPPASRQISAPRGVTYFWTFENPLSLQHLGGKG